MTLPLLWVSLAFLSGIVLNRFLHAPLAVWLIITVIPIIDAIFLRRRFARLASLNVWLVAASCIALLLGARRRQPGSRAKCRQEPPSQPVRNASTGRPLERWPRHRIAGLSERHVKILACDGDAGGAGAGSACDAPCGNARDRQLTLLVQRMKKAGSSG